MSKFMFNYIMRNLMAGSHQEDADVLRYRASVLENKHKEHQGANMDAYIK